MVSELVTNTSRHIIESRMMFNQVDVKQPDTHLTVLNWSLQIIKQLIDTQIQPENVFERNPSVRATALLKQHMNKLQSFKAITA